MSKKIENKIQLVKKGNNYSIYSIKTGDSIKVNQPSSEIEKLLFQILSGRYAIDRTFIIPEGSNIGKPVRAA